MRITVFTPTYNRAYIIENLYRSLQAQTFHDFEWLVIDDGSIDGTEELFDVWKTEDNPFVIRYYKFENIGKQREINRALSKAYGELFFTVDSDDVLKENALELIDSWEKDLPKDEKYCGLAGNSEYADQHFVNPIFDNSYQDSTMFARIPEMCTDCRHIGYDRAWVFYTDIHKKYPYPEIDDEKFIPEAVAWNRMANDGYKIRCFNDIIYIFEHQDDGYTNSISKTLIRNPNGYGIWISEQMKFFKYNWKRRLIQYYCFYCDLKEYHSRKEIAEYVKCPSFIMLCIAVAYSVKHRSKT